MFGKSQLHDYFKPSDRAELRALLVSIGVSARAENQATARRLAAIAELFELRRRERGERADWAVDTWAAVERRCLPRCGSASRRRAAT